MLILSIVLSFVAYNLWLIKETTCKTCWKMELFCITEYDHEIIKTYFCCRCGKTYSLIKGK